jgi:hypothetical protein
VASWQVKTPRYSNITPSEKRFFDYRPFSIEFLENKLKITFLNIIFTKIRKDLIIFFKINRKLRVATEIGSTFFWFLTSYRAAEKV